MHLMNITAINEKFAEPMSDDEMGKLIEQQGKIQEKLDAMDAWELDSRLEMAMDALRCPPGDTAVNILSGGENAAWPFAGCSLRNRTSCFLTSLRTIWMPRVWHGLSIICRTIRDCHCSNP